MDLYFILFQNINQPNHVFYFYKIPYFTFLQNTAQPASDYKIYSAGHRTEDHCQQPARQTSQPSRPSQPGRPSQPSIALAHSILYFRKISLACQSRQAAKLGIFYFYAIPYFAFLQNTAPPASGPGTTASADPDPARQPNQPAQPAQPVQTGRQPGYFLFLQNTVFYIFTKYRILHFYKIPLHRPEDRGPLRTPPSPVS